jgi:hypothetical protein
VPPEGLRSHIRQAVEVAGARRIGHGVAVMHEDGAHELLRTMAERGVLVEINLTSNDVILGVRGRDHPLHAYLAAGVPVALSTDDEGVARSEMTMEYLKAVREQELGYVTLKTMARNSLQHAFVEGESLWSDPRAFTPVAECSPRGGGLDGAACDAYVAGSTRARLQRDLERAFARFEARQAEREYAAAGRGERADPLQHLVRRRQRCRRERQLAGERSLHHLHEGTRHGTPLAAVAVLRDVVPRLVDHGRREQEKVLCGDRDPELRQRPGGVLPAPGHLEQVSEDARIDDANAAQGRPTCSSRESSQRSAALPRSSTEVGFLTIRSSMPRVINWPSGPRATSSGYCGRSSIRTSRLPPATGSR